MNRSPADAAFATDAAEGTGADRPFSQPAADGDPSPPPSLPTSPPPLPIGAPVPAVQGPRPTPVAAPCDPVLVAAFDPGDDAEQSAWRDWWLHLPSWLASMVVHLALVLLLALATTLAVVRDSGSTLVVSTSGPNLAEEQPEELSAEMESSADVSLSELLEPAPLADLPANAMTTGPIRPISPDGDPKLLGGDADAAEPAAGVGGNSLEMRLNGQMRSALLQSGGGTPQSEEAVLMALRWLAEHQEYDGSWSFQHQKHPKCHGSCANPGSTPGNIAATSLALLPFLGTGQTHLEGTYKQTIERGLGFLTRSMKYEGKAGSLWDPYGTMYGHGLAAIVLCEAYGMTHDRMLREPAQAAVNFIVEAQDPRGGGWRYHPQTPGDTSVVGWQLMALKSAQMAYLRVPQSTLRKTGYFLDSVQSQRGAVYGYTGPDARRPATTAIGLLCRMYLGWDREVAPLAQGVQTLSTLGPSTDKTSLHNNLYYDYYATQVMHHWGGEPWTKWNAVMRDYFVNTQSKRGHEHGSWYFDGDHGTGAGGRLYCTAMSAMTLEVYYRHMPLYRPQSLRD